MRYTLAPRAAIAAAWVLSVMAMAACSSGGQTADEEEPLTVWTPQTTPARIADQKEVAKKFTQQSGIEVDIVPMAGENQDQALAAGAASGDVPDVMLHATDRTNSWHSQGLLETEPAQEVIDLLGADTFNKRALEAVTVEGEVAAVPSDGWTHVIAYRTDLFDKAGVQVPTSLAELAEAATTIEDELDITGLAFGTQAGTASAAEAIESIFQTNGCELVADGEITIDSPECTEAAKHFLTLRDSSAKGDFDVESARATYMDGQAAMLLFSTHVLDELAGLDEAVLPTCSECADDPGFLSVHTSFITVLDEDNPAQFGTMLSYGIPAGANTEGAKQYIEYVLSDGYEETLGVATEGRFPLRNGTESKPTRFVDAWGDLGIGPEREQTSRQLYGDEFVSSMADGMNAVQRWGMGTSDSVLAGLVFSQSTLPDSLDSLYAGTDPAKVTARMAKAVEEVEAGL